MTTTTIGNFKVQTNERKVTTTYRFATGTHSKRTFIMSETPKAWSFWNRQDKSQWFPKSAFTAETVTSEDGWSVEVTLTVKDWFVSKMNPVQRKMVS